MRQISLRRFFAGLLLLVLSAGLASPLLADKYRGKTVTVYRKDLPPITGLVIDEVEGKSIKVQVGAASVVISLEEAGIRVQITKSLKEQFDEEAAKAKSADDWVKLSKWCGKSDVNLPEERKRCLDEAVKLEPGHKEARALRGDIKKDDGTWVNEEEEKKAQGFVKTPDGKYITKKEADKLSAQKRKIASGLGKREKEMEGLPWAAAKVIPSKHYILKCNSTEEVAKRYRDVLEEYYKAYSEVLKGFEPLYTDPSVVYVFRNREEFMDFTMVSRGVGGYFSPLDKAVRTYHGSFALTGDTDMILAHESTHQFQHRIMKDMMAAPYWIIEAMAVYFGDGSKYKHGKGVQLHTIPRDRLQTLHDAINGGYYVKIKDLLRIHRYGNFMPAYDHGWGLVYWLLNGAKYKVPPKGDGRKVWDQYLRHVALEIAPPTDLEKESRYLTDLILRESRDQKDAAYPSIEKWEEDYKNFILSLKLEPLGKWAAGSRWDGWKEIGIQFAGIDRMKKVDEKDLRQAYREAAAATTDDGLRFWLAVYDNPEVPPDEYLRAMIGGMFTDKVFDEEFRDEDVKLITVSDFFEVAVSKFKGKFSRRRESAVRPGGEEKTAKGSGKAAKKSSGAQSRKSNMPDPTVENSVRVALFSTMDRFYLFCLAGPEGPFSKMEPKFDTVLKSVKLNFDLH